MVEILSLFWGEGVGYTFYFLFYDGLFNFYVKKGRERFPWLVTPFGPIFALRICFDPALCVEKPWELKISILEREGWIRWLEGQDFCKVGQLLGHGGGL